MTLVCSRCSVPKYSTFKTTCTITNTAGLSSCLVPPFSRMLFTYDNQPVNTIHEYGGCGTAVEKHQMIMINYAKFIPTTWSSIVLYYLRSLRFFSALSRILKIFTKTKFTYPISNEWTFFACVSSKRKNRWSVGSS